MLNHDIISDGAEQYGIELPSDATVLFDRYYALLSDWNSRMNLVSAGDMARFETHHILDSLKVASCLDMKKITALLDMGTGAGLPGIPLAVAFPWISVTLVDSRKKRCMFLDQCVSELPERSLSVVRSRVEDLPHSYDNSFSCVITRATTSLMQFAGWCLRFLSSDGVLCAIKGDDINHERLDLASSSSGGVVHISSTVPPHVSGVRRGIVVTLHKK